MQELTVKFSLSPQEGQALQQLSQGGEVTFTIPPELLPAVIHALSVGGVAAVGDLLSQFGKLNFGPLTPLLGSLMTKLVNWLMTYLKVPVPGPAPTPTPAPAPVGGPTIDVK
jgi:hypothetical protein